MSTPLPCGDDLRLIQLARLPEVHVGTKGRTSPVAHYIVRAVLLAIAVDTDNGRAPVSMDHLADLVGVHRTHCGEIVRACLVPRLVNPGEKRRWTRVARCRSWSVNFERLAELARPSAGVPVARTAGGELVPGVEQALVDAVERVLDRMEIGLAAVGPVCRERRAHSGRATVELRARFVRRVCVSYRHSTGCEVADSALARIMGVEAQSVRYALRATDGRAENGMVARGPGMRVAA